MTMEELMAARAAHQAEVADLLAAVAAKIDEGVDGGLYPDGLTASLDEARRLVPVMRAKIGPAVEEPAEPEGE